MLCVWKYFYSLSSDCLIKEERSKEVVISLMYVILLSLCLPSGQLSGFFFHIEPTLGPSLGCACTQPRRTLKWRLLGGTRLSMTSHYPLTFKHQGAFLAFVVSHLTPKGEGVDPLILYSIRVLPLFVLAMIVTLTTAMTITLRCLQEKNLAIYSVCASISEGKQETDCKCLNWSPSISCLRTC